MTKKILTKLKNLIKDAPLRSIPRNLSPELATLTDITPTGNDWIHEIKFDGYRIITVITKKEVRFLTRHGLNWTSKFLNMKKEFKPFPFDTVILDGELVVLDKKKISRFQKLQNAIEIQDASPIQYFVFDIIYLLGRDLSQFPLLKRKTILKQVFSGWNKKHPNIHYTDHIQGEGLKVYKKACRSGLEGTLSKNIHSPYEHRRNRNWLKNKCSLRQEFVIGGFTKPRGSRKHFGALLLGVYNNQKQLIYSGRVGTGFNEERLHQIKNKLKTLIQVKSPFSNLPASLAKNITWVKPKLVGEVEFLEWTEEGSLRHPSFIALRSDKPATMIRKERARKLKVKTNLNDRKKKT